MREIIILNDDFEPTPSSQPQQGLTEAQKLRMVQQKKLAMARLQAKKLQQTQLPFGNSINLTAMLQQANSTSAESGSRPWSKEDGVDGNMAGLNWRLQRPSGEWQQSQLPSHGHDFHLTSSQPPSQQFSTPPRSGGRPWIERGEGQHGTTIDGLREVWQQFEHRNQGYSHPLSRSQAPLDCCDPMHPKFRASGERDEDTERPRDSETGGKRRKSRELDMSPGEDEGRAGRVQRRKSSALAEPGRLLPSYFHPVGVVQANDNAAEKMECKTQHGREAKLQRANVDHSCHREGITDAKFSSPNLWNGMRRPDTIGAQEHEEETSGRADMGHEQYVSPKNHNRNCGFADLDIEEISMSSESRDLPRRAAGEVVGEWRSVRKTPTPGSSFGRHITAPSDQYRNLYEPEPWETAKRWRAQPVAKTSAHASSAGNTLSEDLVTEVPRILKVAKPAPSKQQMQVLKAIAHKKSVFVTGSAGTGKSFILEDALQTLRGMYGDQAVFVTASTGLAACVLGGTTVHSFAGVGIGVDHETKEQLVDKVNKKREVRTRWQKARGLIIDEISMIDGELFDKLEHVARMVKKGRGPEKIWGGLQLIVTGDFFQLPPVKPSNPQKYFAFQADCWQNCFDVQVELTHVFRQSDTEFVTMLNEIRRGVCSMSTLQRLQQCHGPPDSAVSGIEMTRLYPRKMDVSHENDQNLRALGNEMLVYRAKDDAQNDFARRQLDNVRAAAVQPLCVGAQVMLIKNLEMGVGLVNGARGVVVRFSAPDDPSTAEYQKLAKHIHPTNQWPIVRFACDGIERLVGPESWSVFDGDKEVAKRTQIPLMLAWALSVHKCQGMTLDRVETNLSKAFDHGMVYVALSRVKSLEGLHLIGFDPSRIKTHPLVARFYEGLHKDPIVDLDDDDFE